IAANLNGALIAHFQPVFRIGRAQAMLVETAFYLGYFLIAMPAGFFMERSGYKKGILFGLGLVVVGALFFIPAATTLTFGLFMVALFIMASGMAFLETAANPYVTVLGPSESAVTRLNFTQSFNGLAHIVGPWIAGQFIFAGNEGTMESMEERQQAAHAVIGPYAAMAVGVLVILVLFALSRMPEPASSGKLIFNRRIFANRHLTWAIIAQLFYVGAQAGIWGITINYVTELLPGMTREAASKQYLVIGTTLFVVGRFLGTWLLSRFKAPNLLLVYGVIACLLSLAGVAAQGHAAVYAVLSINFFMSIMFPTIFALGVRNLGEETKLGSSFIIMSIVGGAIVPPVMGWISEQHGVQASFVVPAVCFLFVVFYGWSGHRLGNHLSK
ncbi:MAG: L-fucose:H+ symporter permease, partial [Cyclobacteriaceae bacterium]|nr:L-fucose:H+ symporter permease [Cyclobacteriaceae bacterium]